MMGINDITYAINGAVFEVNRVLGPGFLEKVYEKALLIELQQRAHSPQLAAGLASESKNQQNSLQSKIPCSLLQGSSIKKTRA